MDGGGSHAPGAPGIEPRWTSSAKSGVGTALGAGSRVWFTLSHGILNEVYYPRIDEACTRDFGLLVTAEPDYFSEEKRDTHSEVHRLAPGVPAYRLVNTCVQGRYRIEKTVVADPERDVVLQRVRLLALAGDPRDLHLYALLAPHLRNRGRGNTAWVGDYKGVPMIFAEGHGRVLALASSSPWRGRSVGYVGSSDSWQDLSRNHRMTWQYERAENGNVALAGELELPADGDPVTLALGFGDCAAEAGQRALASLRGGFERACQRYVAEWQDWQASLRPAHEHDGGWRTSAMVLRCHEAKSFPGGMIASLSVPWGDSKGDDDLGGYHLVWPRDLVESAGGLLAVGDLESARRVLTFLQSTQEADGHWPQNQWLDGTPYWHGIQMDETALPILLVDLCRRCGALEDGELQRLWPMVRAAAAYVARNGPVTDQDRWEEDPGYSPYTLGAEIAALLAAAEIADACGEPGVATHLRETADAWNERIEDWTFVRDTETARRFGVEGYYVRVAPVDAAEGASPAEGFVPIKNRPPAEARERAEDLVSPDALALVRFGLRSAADPRIAATVRVIDGLLRVETPRGPAFRRYNGDGYGEHADGSPFDGTGIGRPWPLLTAERAHYELAAGHVDVCERLLAAVELFASDGGLLPEQVWDGPEVPARELQPGRPSGSAMPLVWAHSEHVKLIRSLRDGAVFDLPPQPVERYLVKGTRTRLRLWCFNHKLRTMPAGSQLRVQVAAPARLHFTHDAWAHTDELETRDTGLGIHVADLPTAELAPGSTLAFKLFWQPDGRPEDGEFHVEVGQPPA